MDFHIITPRGSELILQVEDKVVRIVPAPAPAPQEPGVSPVLPARDK
jgi:hypothetical protein